MLASLRLFKFQITNLWMVEYFVQRTLQFANMELLQLPIFYSEVNVCAIVQYKDETIWRQNKKPCLMKSNIFTDRGF
jgi:hypothetical protein